MKKRLFYLILLIVVISSILLLKKDNYEEIHIGYQSITSQTWGALIIKNQKLFENKLKEEFKDKKIKVYWHDEISGSVINTSMISNKYQIGFMGDMPLILNINNSSKNKNYDSVLIAIDGKEKTKLNQNIIVLENSNIKNIKDLKGKTIATPIGSSAYYFLINTLKKEKILNEVNIINQDVALASQMLLNKKIDAFAIWSPYPNFLNKKYNTRNIVKNNKNDLNYLAGVIANKNWCLKNNKYCKLFIESLKEAHEILKTNKKFAIDIIKKESSFDKKIIEEEINNINWDHNIYLDDIKNLEDKKKFLIDEEVINNFNLGDYIYEKHYK